MASPNASTDVVATLQETGAILVRVAAPGEKVDDVHEEVPEFEEPKQLCSEHYFGPHAGRDG